MLLKNCQYGRRTEKRGVDELIQGVQLLGGCVLFEQLAGDLALSGQDNAILGQYTQSSTSVRDGLKSVFDLIETALGREDGCS